MEEPFSIDGEWWIPTEGESSRISGRLDYTVESLNLKLHGVLGDSELDDTLFTMPTLKFHPVLHGWSLESVPITLYECHVVHWKSKLPFEPLDRQLTVTKLHANRAVVGAHLGPKDEPEIQESHIHISNAEYWYDENNFVPRNDPDHPATSLISKAFAEPVTVEIPEKRIEIAVTSTLKHKGGGPRKISLTNDVRFTLNAPENVECVKNISEIERHLQDLMTLLVGTPCFVLSTHLEPNNDTLFKSNNIQSYFCDRIREIHHISRRADVLFPFTDISQEWPKLIRSWLTPDDAIFQSRTMYFSTLYNPSAYMESKFLPLTTAIECFSRATQDGQYLPDEEYQVVAEKLKQITSKDFPNDLSQSWKSRILYGNEHSLRKRLKVLMSDLEEDTKALFCMNEHAFITGVVTTRNYFTHYTEGLKSGALSGIELYWMTEKLKDMLSVLFLKHYGISEAKIQKAFRKGGEHASKKEVWSNVKECLGD